MESLATVRLLATYGAAYLQRRACHPFGRRGKLGPTERTLSEVIEGNHKLLKAIVDSTPGLNLTPAERRICYMLFNGFTEDQVAADLGCSIYSVQKRLHRCRQREGFASTLALVCRYVMDYLGVGEAWDEKELPVADPLISKAHA